MLRCKSDGLVVHPHYICDGQVQCRMFQDDERMCKDSQILECPTGCTCVGQTAHCNASGLVTNRRVPQLLGLIVELHYVNLELLKRSADLRVLAVFHIRVTSNVLYLIRKQLFLHRLTLRDNDMTAVEPYAFDGLHFLRDIEIKENSLHSISSNAFSGLNNVLQLNLSSLSIRSLGDYPFSEMNVLQIIDLSNNNIKRLKKTNFQTKRQITLLILINNSISYIETNTFTNFHIQHIVFNNLAIVCFVKSYQNNVTMSKLDICPKLLPNRYFTLLYVLVSLAIFISNFLVIIRHSKSAINHSILIQNLAIADTLYAGYLIVISVTHLQYSEQFPLYVQIWIASHMCKLSTFLFAVSILQSKIILLIMLYSYFKITKGALGRKASSKKRIYFTLIFLWTVTGSLVCAYVVFVKNNYSSCAPFLVNSTGPLVSYIAYVVSVTLIVITVVTVIVTYTAVISAIASSARSTNRIDTVMSQLQGLRFKRTISVLTCVLANSFVVVLPLLNFIDTSLAQKYDQAIYVLFVPLEACLNPFMYTLIPELKRKRTMWKQKKKNPNIIQDVNYVTVLK